MYIYFADTSPCSEETSSKPGCSRRRSSGSSGSGLRNGPTRWGGRRHSSRKRRREQNNDQLLLLFFLLFNENIFFKCIFCYVFFYSASVRLLVLGGMVAYSVFCIVSGFWRLIKWWSCADLTQMSFREILNFIYRRPTLYPLEIAVDFLKSL